MSRLTEKIRALAEETALGLGVEVEDVELLGGGRRRLLRVAIDKAGGVTLEDCEAFSKQFGAVLDVEDPIQGAYTLEVGSPGLDRPLRKPGDFERSLGKTARVVTGRPVEGRTFFVGRIEDVRPDGITLAVDDRKFDIMYEDITRARLEIEI